MTQSRQRPEYAALHEVIRALLAIDPAACPGAARTRVCNVIAEVGGMREALSLTRSEWLALRGVGATTFKAFEEWVLRRTEQLGCRADVHTVRVLLVRMVVSEQDSSSAVQPGSPSPQRVHDGSIAGLARCLPEVVLQRELIELPDLSFACRIVLKDAKLRRIEALIGWSDSELLEIPGANVVLIENLREVLVRLFEEEGRPEGVPEPGAEEILRARWLCAPMLERFATRVAELGDRDRHVFEYKWLDEERHTLADIADGTGVTRARAHQISDRARKRVTDHGLLAAILDDKIHALRHGRTTPLTLAGLEQADAWFAGVEAQPVRLERVLEAAGSGFGTLSLPGAKAIVPAKSADLDAHTQEFRKALAQAGGEHSLEELAAGYCAQRGIEELADVLLECMGDVVAVPTGYRPNPTKVERIETVMIAAGRPMTIAALEAEMTNLGLPDGPRVVSAGVDQLRHKLLPVGPNTYLHEQCVQRVEEYEDLRPMIDRIMESRPGYQWSLREIQVALQELGAYEHRGIPPENLMLLLRRHPLVQELRRNVWAYGETPVRRLNLVEIAVGILEQHGAPMGMKQLKAKIHEQRGFGTNMRVRWPLVSLPGHLLGLGPRDLGISDETFVALRDHANGLIKASIGRLGPGELRAIYTELAPDGPDLSPRELAKLLAYFPTSRLDREDTGIRHASQPRID